VENEAHPLFGGGSEEKAGEICYKSASYDDESFASSAKQMLRCCNPCPEPGGCGMGKTGSRLKAKGGEKAPLL
jgi:hypothetical protein